MTPKRIQRKRTKGWRMPPNTMYVGRPTEWGNPFEVSNGDCPHPDCGPGSHPVTTASDAVNAYRKWLKGMLAVDPQYLRRLRGYNLACWCPIDSPCHADVLLVWANS